MAIVLPYGMIMFIFQVHTIIITLSDVFLPCILCMSRTGMVPLAQTVVCIHVIFKAFQPCMLVGSFFSPSVRLLQVLLNCIYSYSYNTAFHSCSPFCCTCPLTKLLTIKLIFTQFLKANTLHTKQACFNE